MTVEQLLKPRYKVIADYPNMGMDGIGVGDIIDIYHSGFTSPGKVMEMYDKYPHLFRKLEWWEERYFDLTGMYIRFGNHAYYQLVSRIDHPHMELWEMTGRLGVHEYPIHGSLPATKEEYENFLTPTSSPKQ